jgi:hypothetical protein
MLVERDPTASCWTAKIAEDKLRNGEFPPEFNLYRRVYKLHDNDVLRPGNGSYGHRVFIRFAGEIPSDDDLYAFGQAFCTIVNQSPELAQDQRLVIHRDTFLDRRNLTWYDLLGNTQSYTLSRRILSDILRDYFQQHPEVLPQVWPKGSTMAHVAQSLGVDISYVKEGNEQDIFNGNN